MFKIVVSIEERILICSNAPCAVRVDIWLEIEFKFTLAAEAEFSATSVAEEPERESSDVMIPPVSAFT